MQSLWPGALFLSPLPLEEKSAVPVALGGMFRKAGASLTRCLRHTVSALSQHLPLCGPGSLRKPSLAAAWLSALPGSCSAALDLVAMHLSGQLGRCCCLPIVPSAQPSTWYTAGAP